MSDKVEEGARNIVQALHAATEGLNYAAACVKGMQAEIEDIKRRLSELESLGVAVLEEEVDPETGLARYRVVKIPEESLR